MPHYNSDGYGGHLYVPWWMWDKHKELELPARVPHRGRRRLRHAGHRLVHRHRQSHEGYGVTMKQAIRDEYGTNVGLSGRGEMIPNEQSYCEIDPEVKDRWGIPVLRFHWQWSDHELNQVRHMQETFRGILEGMGGRSTAGQRDGPAQAPRRQAAATGRSRPADSAASAPHGRSRAAARSSTRSARCAWATIRRRAR